MCLRLAQPVFCLPGSPSGKEKLSCWKAFLEADDSILNALAKLAREEKPDTDIKVKIERFVFQLYLPRTDETTVKELKWFLFRKRQAECDRLPPTQASLHQAIMRAHFLLMVWNKDTAPHHVLPSSSDYGWAMENAEWAPVMTTLPPAPEAVIELGALGRDVQPIDANVEELGYCAWTYVAALTTENARTSMMTTSISVMREGLRNDSKNVYVSFSGILKKTIDFHKSLPQESEFLNKCGQHWQIKFGLFFISASCCL